MAYNPQNPNGQATSANSSPVVIASNQSAVAVSGTVAISGTTAVSGTVTANAGTNLNTSALALESGGNLAALNTKTPAVGVTTSSASRPVVQSIDTASGGISVLNLNQTGTATNNSAVEIVVNSAGSVTIGVSGTFVATLSVQVTMDGTSWTTLTYNSLTNVVNSSTQATITAPGVFTLQTVGWLRMRITSSAYTSGTATIALRAVSRPSIVAINSPLPTGTNAIGSAALNQTNLVVDVTSAPITSNTTTGQFIPTTGVAYSVSIPVTASSGTFITLDVNIEESDDNGNNWFVVYSFPRISANGVYRSPMLTLRGNRVRYVQTVGGTSPSFTRSINRLQSNGIPQNPITQLIDRTINLTTLNSTTPILNVQNCTNLQVAVYINTATTSPRLMFEGSNDNGATWFDITGVITIAGVTISENTIDTNVQLVRARNTQNGSNVGSGYYVILRGF